MSKETTQILDMTVRQGSLMPVIWQVVAVEGSEQVHLRGKVIRVLIRDTGVPEYISATVPRSRIHGGLYFIQPGVMLVSAPYGSDWLPSGGDLQYVAAPIGFADAGVPQAPTPERSEFYSWSYVAQIENHRQFFVLATDEYTSKVEGEIIKGQGGRTGRVQIVVGQPASPRVKQTLMSRSEFTAKRNVRRYHPYRDEFEAPVMSEWTSLVPPLMFVPELMENESYTLLGYVSIQVPPQSIQIRREHEVETQPVLRSSTLHKSVRANLTHEWTMQFVVEGEDINNRLVPLLRQIDRCPFLPIVNILFNQMGITEVVVESVEISTIQDYPNALQVQLSGRKFDTGGLGFMMPFGLNFNWPLFKLYTDYLPRFLPIDIPMNGKVQLLVPSDEYIAQVLDRFFETGRIGEKLGFAPGGGSSPTVTVPPEILTQPNIGHFALLSLPDDPNRVGRYEVVRVDNPRHFKHLARAVMDGVVEGLEARSITVSGGDVQISRGVIPNSELDRLIRNVDSGKQGLARSAMESVAFCWRMDSIGKVSRSELNSTLSRVLNATFQSKPRERARSAGPVSDGVPRAVDKPDMVPFLPEGLNVVWQSVSVGFSNIVSALRRDVGDPVMQYLGKSDITIVLQGVADAEGLSVLRSLFDRFIAITYLLRGISFIQPIRIHFRIENEIARLMGLEEVVPISLDVHNLEGSPDAYVVTLTFVSMDHGGVQRRAMRRLSDNITRSESMFTLTYSGLDASKELDRLTAALRRSELYPDLRLPTYGLLLEWCRALAYNQGMARDFVNNSLRGLAPGLESQYYEQYVASIRREMARFLREIGETGLINRMSRTPYVFADPDFFFHDGNGIGSIIRRSIQQQLSRGADTDVVAYDDTGVQASITGNSGRYNVAIHDSHQSLAQSLQEVARRTVANHPSLGHREQDISEMNSSILQSFVDLSAESAGVSEDPLAASARDQSGAYREFSDRFRDAYAIKRSDILMRYDYDVRDDSPAQMVSQLENGSINQMYLAAQALRQLFEGRSEIDFREAAPVSGVAGGVMRIIDGAVDSMVQQAANPPLDKSFKVTNAATDAQVPATWTVVWKPVRWGLTVRVLRLVAPKLKSFMMGMIEQESGFNPFADSGKAYGIGQFTDATWNGLLSSGRFGIYLLRGGQRNSPVSGPGRWDAATIMSLYYLMELVTDAVYNVVGKDEQVRDDFAEYLCFDQPGLKAKVKSDPTAVLNAPAGSSVAERLLVLGACLYNAGPQALRSVLRQLASNVRSGKRGASLFAVSRTDRDHGRLVYERYQKWLSRLPSDGSAGMTPQHQEVSHVSGVNPMYSPAVLRRPEYQLPENAGDPFYDVHNVKNFPLLQLTGWSDMARHQPHGRLLQCFPTYCMLLVQGGRWVRWTRFWDHFYGLFSVMSIDVHKSRESPQHTAEIILANSYRQLSNLTVTQAYAQAAIAGMRPFQYVQGEELMRGSTGSDATDFLVQLVKSVQNSLFPLLGDYERHVWNQEMKALFLHPGERVHLRIGYGADAAALPVVFNGTIASVDIQGSVIRMLALGDGREFLREIATEGQPYKNSNLLGQTVEVRNILIDMLVSRRADSIPVIGPVVYTFSAGGLLNDSRFGIESFGRIEALAGSTVLQDVKSGNVSVRTFKILGMASFQAAEGEVGVNIYNSQRDSSNISIGMLPLLDTLTLGLSQMARNGDYIAIELKQGTVWDVFRNCQLAVLDALMSVEPFGLRSTLFFGRGNQALHYEYYDAAQIEALGLPDVASHIALGGYWRIMKFKQYRQYHLAVSEWNLIANELTASSERMWNEVQSFDAEGVPGNKFTFDPAIVPEERKPLSFHSALSTTLMSQLSLGAESNWISVLARIGIVRNLIGERAGLAMPIRAVNNVSANLVREGVSLMYDGSIVLAGAAEIKPHDFLFISDQLRAMQGTVVVREVEHHFSTQHGYTTLIVPDACVLGNGDLDTINIVQASKQAWNLIQFYRMRSELLLIYRCYLMGILYGASMALGRLRFITRRIPGADRMMDRFLALMSSGMQRLKPTRQEVWKLVVNAFNSSRYLAKDFFGTLFHGAWTVRSMADTLRGLALDSLGAVRSLLSGRGIEAFGNVASAVQRLAGLGAARPIFALRNVASAVVKAVGTRGNLLLLLTGGIVEMVNRKLNSYYCCRLYPVRVNGMPLTAGIRGHFGTVEGDDPAPMQRVMDILTLQGLNIEEQSPAVLKMGASLVKLLWPLQRNVKAMPGTADEELENARQQFERRSRYDMMGVFGSVAEIYGVSAPTLREGSDELVRREPFRRSTVGYARGDDPAKGDYLLDYMQPQASAILRQLVQELRRRGVQVAIHQGRRSLEEQRRLYAQLQSGQRGKAVAKPTPGAPHVSGRAIDVQYRYPDGTYRSSPPPDQGRIILQVVREFNVRYAPAKVRWLGDRSRYSGSVYEPWHFDVSLPGS
jgi:hypothetical protein